MKKIAKWFARFLLVLQFVSLFTFAAPQPVTALESCPVLSGAGVTLPPFSSGATHSMKIDISNLDPNPDFDYYVKVKATKNTDDEAQSGVFKLASGVSGGNSSIDYSISGSVLTITIKDPEALKSSPLSLDPDQHYVFIYRNETIANLQEVCDAGSYFTLKNTLVGGCTLQIFQDGPPDENGNALQCTPSGCLQKGKPLKLVITGLENEDGPFSGEVRAEIGQIGGGVAADPSGTASNGKATLYYTPNEASQYEIQIVERRLGVNFPFPGCNGNVTIKDFCQPEECNTTPISFGGGSDPYILCNQINQEKFPDQYAQCTACTGGETEEDQEGVWTAIGCIKKAPAEIAQSLIRVGLMMGGGAALLTMLAAGFILSVSQGDPKRTEEAKDMITAAFIGLIFILFSVSILQFIGFSILKIPGFGE